MFTSLFKTAAAGFLLTLAVWSYQAGWFSAPHIGIGILHDAAVFTNSLK